MGVSATGYAAKTVYEVLADRLAASRTALVVVDMQNDFCAPGGYIANLGLNTSRFSLLIEPLNAALSEARKHEVLVTWLVACYEDELIPPSMQIQKARRGISAVCCRSGSWGHAFYGVAPLPTERVFTKSTYSGFSNPDFERYLRQSEVETLLFAGVQTNVCVESTVRDAHARGFNVALLEDCLASHTPALHDATVANIRFLLGDVCSTAQISAIWSATTSI